MWPPLRQGAWVASTPHARSRFSPQRPSTGRTVGGPPPAGPPTPARGGAGHRCPGGSGRSVDRQLRGGGKAKSRSPDTAARVRGASTPAQARGVRGRPSDRPAVMSVLGYAPAIRKGGNRVKDIALTFDDGPGPDTPRIAAELQRLHASATFFVLGRSAMAAAGGRGLRALAAGALR